MAAPIPLRSDFDAMRLRLLAKRSRDPDQTRRLLALATIYEGGSRSEAARIGCVTLQSVRDWVMRFNAHGPDGLVTGRAPGAKPLPGDVHRQALQRVIEGRSGSQQSVQRPPTSRRAHHGTTATARAAMFEFTSTGIVRQSAIGPGRDP